MDLAIEKCTSLWTVDYQHKVISVLRQGKTGCTLSRDSYHILKTYKLVSLGGVDKVAKHNDKYMAHKDEVINIIRTFHLETSHGGEKKTHKKLQDQYCNIPKSLVQEYIKHCERCVEKRRKTETSSGVVVRPLTVTDLNDRCQVDLVDMQTMKDGSYRFILHYMEYLTKFSQIRPLKTKTAEEVAKELLYIFLDIGAPHILQSDNGREFTAEVIRELSTLWPGCVLVNGRPRHPQSQGSVERGNGSMKLKLQSWMRDNNTASWSVGIRFVQWSMNNTYHEAIHMEPYKALTGNKPRCGLATKLPADFLARITTGVTEEELIQLMDITTEDVEDDRVPTDELPTPQSNTPISQDAHTPESVSVPDVPTTEDILVQEDAPTSEVCASDDDATPEDVPFLDVPNPEDSPTSEDASTLEVPIPEEPPTLAAHTPEEALTIEATNTEAIITVNAEVHAKDTDVIEHPA